MERRVTVNDGIERVELDVPEDLEGAGPGQSTEPGYGTCLYLGAAGERCSRMALQGSYCAQHHTDPELRSEGRNYARVIVASIALIIVVWPYVSDLARELVRWLAVPR